MNTHPMTGKPLRQPDPPALRRNMVWDNGQPCLEHSVAYTGSVPCTGALACRNCGTTWDDEGNPETPAERAARLEGD